MATYEDAKDELVTCPYNPSHRVKASRLQLHLAKCEKAHRDAHVATCPFNAQHRPYSGELNHHLLNCECRGPVDRQLIASAESTYRGHVGVPSYHSQLVEANENWDNEIRLSSTYRPSVEPPNGGIRTDFSEMQPAQRRRYYNNLSINGVESEENTEKSETQPELREPRTLSQAQILEQVEHIQDLHNIGLGRGQATVLSKKIAANIFGKSPPPQQMRQPNAQPQLQAATLGMGRGTNAVNSDMNGDEDDLDGWTVVNRTKMGRGRGTRK